MDPQRQDASPYVYAGNNPVGFLDPTGGDEFPFYVYMGFETTEVGRRRKSYTADAAASAFGRDSHGKQSSISADMFNTTGWAASWAESKPQIYTRKPGGDYGKMYLFVGDRGVDKMERLAQGIKALDRRRPGFASQVTITDFSGKEGTGVDIRKLFQNTGRYPLLVHAGLETDDTRSGGQVVTSFTTDKGNYKPSEFVAHVHKLEKSHLPQLLTAQEETTLREPQDTAVHDIEMIDQGEVTGDLSQRFYHEGEFIQFPTVPALQTTTPPATTLTGQSDHSTVPGFTDAQWKKFSEPLSPELVSVLDQTLGESWSTD